MERATILMPQSTGLSRDQDFRQTPIFLKDQNMKKKYQHYIDAQWIVLPTQTETTTVVATSN